MQTAHFISRNTGIEVKVELGLHEWLPDLSNQYTTSEESFRLAEDFVKCKGVYPAGMSKQWEPLYDMRKRMRTVVDKYTEYAVIILVGHGMALRTITYIEQMKPAEIVECTYEIGQRECEYSFF